MRTKHFTIKRAGGYFAPDIILYLYSSRGVRIDADLGPCGVIEGNENDFFRI